MRNRTAGTATLRASFLVGLLASTALIAPAAPAAAGCCATWSPPVLTRRDGNGPDVQDAMTYNDPRNWSPSGVPTDFAVFTNRFFKGRGGNNVIFIDNASILNWQIVDSHYSFANNGFTITFRGVEGDGPFLAIVGSADIFNSNGTINFQRGSIASGTPTVRIDNLGAIIFSHKSSAGSATINNLATTTRAGRRPGGISFNDSSSAGNAIINNRGVIDFHGNSSAGNATITTEARGLTRFFEFASGGTAKLIANARVEGGRAFDQGVVDFTGLQSDGTTVGSMQGIGRFITGSKRITPVALSPGNSIGTLEVDGNLTLGSESTYIVEFSDAGDHTQVTGTANLAGAVALDFLPKGRYLKQYNILHADGGFGGTVFGNVIAPPNFTAALSYTATDVLLDVTPALGLGSALTRNAANVADPVNGFFINNGTLPPAIAELYDLTGAGLVHGLSLVSGEAATGAQKVGFQLTDQFLNLMLDPFVDGRSGIGGADQPALGFAPERASMPPAVAHAYAAVLKAAPKATPVHEPHWTVWGTGFGGSNRTSGDLAVTGSHDLAARTAGIAGGFDYRLTPDTMVGLAFAGAGTDWSLSQGLGGGKSDAFQAGVYAATRAGSAYLAAAFAFANHWMSTDRFALAGSHLTADFTAQSYGGRLEGGYRFGTNHGGITPYAAIQAQAFRTPGYGEVDVNSGGSALAFNGRTATDIRSELGARFDRVLATYSNAVLALRSRLAWAHDWVSDATLAPAFQGLPGTSFIVNGALPVKDSALASAGAELRLANGVTLSGKFDGEFARGSSTYGGTGTLRVSW